MKNVQTRFAKSKYSELNELGTRFNLSFSSRLVFSNKIIALDGTKKCLLVLNTDNELGEPCLIDLNDVAVITVKKSYGSIKQGELKNKGIEEFLKRIDLEFEFSNRTETIVLPFYEPGTDDPGDRTKLNRNAKTWHMILSALAGS